MWSDRSACLHFLGRKVSKRWSNLAFFNTLQSFVFVQNIEEVFTFELQKFINTY